VSARFAGRLAVVTGASSGIGAVVARRLAREGAKVVLAARTAATLEERVAEIAAEGGQAWGVPVDLTDPAGPAVLVERAVDKLGGVDILVNNAGANFRGRLDVFSATELAGLVQINLATPIVLTRLVLPHMKRAGRGAVVNVASLAGRVPVIHEATYSATKFGLRAFTLALAEELAPDNIRVSVVSPGPVETGFILEDLDRVPDIIFSQPMSSAETVAEAILQCAADGKVERALPRASGYLTTMGYVFPALRRLLTPLMQKKGRAAKERYRQRAGDGRSGAAR
jgi:short-subunit dehydrogenase